MPTILVKEAMRRISVLLNDTSPQFQRFPETRLVDFFNDAHLAISKFLPAASSRVDAIKLQPGTLQTIQSIAAANCKPGDGSTPSVPILGTQLLSIQRNMGSDGLTPGRVVRVVKHDMLDDNTPNWHSAPTATTVLSYTYDPQTPRYFYVTPPVPASPAVWVTASYNAQPISIPNTGSPGSELYLMDGSSTTLISLADEYIDDLVNYTVARANMMDVEWADANKATYFAGLFLGSLNSKVSALTGNNPNLAVLPFAPEPIGRAK